MTEQELIELCSLGESTTVQYKLEFTTQKQIAEELVAFANTRGGIIVFDESTTQKATDELISTTQKEDLATQKGETTTPKPLNATQKKILKYLDSYPKATRKDVAQALGNITEDGVKFNIGLMQQYGALKRKGGRKNGEWVVNPAYLSQSEVM